MNVKIEKVAPVGLLVIDNPPVNALSPSVAEEMQVGLKELLGDDEIQAIVVTATGRTFIAGADVKQFLSMIETGQTGGGAGLYDLTHQLEQSTKPVVCALFGTTLGGGLELAMACHYRIAMANSVIGQPEVKLGLIPGAGGTQRLPRLCGPEKAAELCGFGEPISVEEGLQLGIIDRIVDADLKEEAISYAIKLVGDGPRPTCDREEKLVRDPESTKRIETIRSHAMEVYQGSPACFHAIDAVEKSSDLSFEDGLAIENLLFVQALQSDEARNLIHLFFAEREATKIPEIKDQKEFLAVDQIGFPGLKKGDVDLLEMLIRRQVELRIVDQDSDLNPQQQLLFVGPETDADSLFSVTSRKKSVPEEMIVVDTSNQFDPFRLSEAGVDASRVIGMRYWKGQGSFAEVGISDQTNPLVIKTLVQFLKRLKCSFVVQKPSPDYASDRIKSHRLDESDLKIEVWKLLQEKIIYRAGDIDLIQVHCFGLPRHKTAVGANYAEVNR